MKYILIVLTLIFTGCSQTTTYKAKSLGWSKFIEAKTIVYSETLCKEHYGYYNSTQIETWSGYENGNYNQYTSVKIRCYDGYEKEISILDINNVVSPKVAELLKSQK